MKLRSIQDINCTGKTVLIRVDCNVPIENGVVCSTQRIDASLPTIRYVLEQGGAVILVSHLGRPTEGVEDSKFSLAPVANVLSQKLGIQVPLIKDFLTEPLPKLPCVLCENIRFQEGEKECTEALSKALASLCDIFVMDAFGVSHRAHASTYGIAKYAKQACAGLLLQKEVSALDKALIDPKVPRLGIIGGSKVSTKLTVLEQLATKLDYMIVGGGIANTFLLAQGHAIGVSLCEPEFISLARSIMETTTVLLPKDVGVVKHIAPTSPVLYKGVDSVEEDESIVDVGMLSSMYYDECIAQAKTIIWNGPIGIFEIPSMAMGTEALCMSVAASQAYSLVGGGDTLRALEQFGVADRMSYISTGGGAFLEYIEGKEFPSLHILEQA